MFVNDKMLFRKLWLEIYLEKCGFWTFIYYVILYDVNYKTSWTGNSKNITGCQVFRGEGED